jgi:formate dehydrogenase major subunit
MELTRRGFLTSTGVGFGASLGLLLGRPERLQAATAAGQFKTHLTRETTTICPYCGVGCSIIVHSRDDKVVNTEGDPEHPINEGSLCPKGSSLYQLANNEKRLKKVLYRAAGAKDFQEKDWKWAAKEIAKRIKKTRDETFTEKNAKGQVVNRTTAIASVGSAALDNEECWLYHAFLRAMGLVYIEHQARLCHSATVASLAATFGRGAMTNHWIDLRNSDCILAMGSNPAENHPVSFKWVTEAKKRGAKLISVDPRFTRTSSVADIYAQLRSGTDIAFLGGMIKYITDNDLIHKEYVVNYTNASFLIADEFKFDEIEGVFSGYNPESRKYDSGTWKYQIGPDDEPKKDPTLKDPRCVYQLLKKHYSRYTPEKVVAVTGTPVEDLLEVYKTYTATGAPEKAGTIMYAMGWTQHTAGTQNIRAMAMIQLLLGNIGRAGGGVNAMRGESNVQGSTDHGLLFHILPGYLKTPNASQLTLEAYNTACTPKPQGKLSANWWGNYPNYSTSLLMSMFGKAATKENDFGYSWLPKLDDGVNYSWLTIFDEMYNGNIKGFFSWGQNPACSGTNANKVRKALARLDWLVNVNIFPSETGWFFQDKNLGIDSKDINTEVFVLPAAVSVEKEGSITNSGRWMQWRYKAANPPGEALPDAEIINLIYEELKKLYVEEGGKTPDPIANLKWDYFDKNIHPDGVAHAVAKEINGYFLQDVDFGEKGSFKKGQLVPSFAFLKNDGSTSSGCWIYCNSYTEKGNMSAKRTRETSGIGLNPEWAWCWPVNRRIIYNRASVDLKGHPWDTKRPVIAWEDGKWVGDVPDGSWPPLQNPDGTPNPASKYAFIMKPEGYAQIFATGLADGPFPEHYEPLETPVTKNLFNNQMVNPASKLWSGPADQCSTCGSTEFPYVCSTYRLTEHWQTGVMTRYTPWLLEMQPQLFIEMSRELAKEKSIESGDQVRVCSIRGAVTAIALVTARFKPMNITVDGTNTKKVHQVGLPWCFGWMMPEDGSGGDSANLLTPNVGDANTMIPETKAFMVDISKLDLKKHSEVAL